MDLAPLSLYGTGVDLIEAPRLRVQDVDLQ